MKFSRDWFENTENRNEPTRFSREWFETGATQPQSETPKTPTIFETATGGAQPSVQTPKLSATQAAMQSGKNINFTDELRANDAQFVSSATQGGKLFNTAVANSKPADLNYAETDEIRAHSERRRKLQSAQEKVQQADLETRNTFYYLWAKDGEDAALNWLNDAEGQQDKYQKTKANNARASVYAGMKNAEDFAKQTESGREQFQAYMQNVKAANSGENVTAESTGMTYVGHEGFEEDLDAMTPDERNTFYYIWSKGGAERAKDYLDFLRDNPNSSINNAIVQGMVDYAKDFKEMEPGFDKAVGYVSHAIGTGLGKAMLTMPQLFTDEEIDTRSIDAFNQEMTKDMSDLGRFAYGAGNSIGAMLPSIGVSIATGNPIVGAGVMSVSSGGSAMNEMLKQGYSAGQARTYGAMVGASEALMQYFLGGISKLSGGSKILAAAEKNLSHIDNALVRYIGTMGLNVAREVGEEELQLFLEPLIKAAVTGEEYDAPTWQAMLETAISTAISTGILEVGNTTAYNPQTTSDVTQVPKVNSTENTANAANPPLTSDLDGSPLAQPQDVVGTETTLDPIASTFQQAQQGADVVQQAMQPTQGQSLGDVANRDDVLRLPPGKKKSQTKTLPHYEQVKDVPDESRQPIYYDPITEEESFTGAYQRFSQDRQAQVERLKNSNNWSGEDNDISLLELEMRRREAMESGNWDAYNEWREIDTLHGGTEVAQSLQARAKRKRISGSGVVQLAAEALDTAKQGTDTNEVLTTVSQYGEEYDRAVASRSVDDLVSIIKDTSKARRTGSFVKNKLSNAMNNAIERIASYARAEVASGQTNGKYFEFLRDFAASGIVNIATDTQKVDTGKALKTIRRNSMLSKASTILRNLVGNGVFDLTDSVSVNMAVPVDILLSKFTGTRSTALDASVFSSEKREGQLDGLAMATMAVGLDVDPEGMASKYENTGNRTFKMSGNTMSRLMSTWEKYMGYALTATDEYAKGGISAETQRGIDKLYERGLIKDESLRDAGEQMALYRSFQQDGVLSDISLGIRNAANKAKIFGRNIPVGDFVFPFVKTPSNLGQAAIDYSPVGIANGIVQTAKVLKDAKNGKLTAAQQAKAVQALGRGINGTALIAAFAALAKAGIIHILGVGDDDENKDRVAAEKMRGLNGTQWNLDATLRWARGESTDFREGDTLLNIGFLEPMNAQMTIGALIAEDAKDGLTFREAGLDVLSGVVQSVLDLPVMQSLKNVADSYRYSAGENEGEKLIDAGLQFAAETATSFIPNSIAGIAKGIDPYERDVYSGDGLLERTRDSALSKIPFARQTLPAKLDSFGNEVTTGNPVLNFIDNNINPGSVDTYRDSSALDEIDRIFGATNDASVYPSRQAPKAIDGSTLTPEQKRQYMKKSGGQYEENIDALMQNADYSRISTELQRDALKSAEKIAAEAGKEAAGVGYKTETKWIAELFDKHASEKEIADAIILKAIENSLGSGEQKWDNLGEMHESGEVSTAIAASLMPKEQREGWERFGGYFSSVNQLLDAVQYYNSKDAEGTKDANGKTVKGESKQDKFNRWLGNTGWSEEQKQAAWLCFYNSLENYRGW